MAGPELKLGAYDRVGGRVMAGPELDLAGPELKLGAYDRVNR